MKEISTLPQSPAGAIRRVPVADILTGERDRSDLGDIAELADSIAAVGLLHPVVVTADLTLVAGDRRLAAARHLGWSDVPVTVVDLVTAADVLRAESDENTCRKPLTPYEASRARERRARVLAPEIQENKGGRPALPPTPQDGLWSASPKETSAKLAEVSRPATQRETRKVGAIGTGYSGSTLDKVDKIRNIAERGVITRGKSETPAPAPVVEIAKSALEDVKVTGAAVDRASRQVEQAVADYVDAGTDVQREKLRKAVYRRDFYGDWLMSHDRLLAFIGASPWSKELMDNMSDLFAHAAKKFFTGDLANLPAVRIEDGTVSEATAADLFHTDLTEEEARAKARRGPNVELPLDGA